MTTITRTALVTGAGGQDGIYLARLLIQEGYRVVGTVRPGARDSPAAQVYLDGVEVVEHDQRDGAGFERLLEDLRPDEIYNLAGFTSVGASWDYAEEVAETNGLAVLRILESLVRHRNRCGSAPRFFQPSSSEMFGTADHMPQTESTPHHPRSPYAVSKSFAHHLTVNYRESYGLFTSTATLYNHESPLRPEKFVTRKISRAVAEIALGQRETVTLGNLDVRRDWGFAGDYVRAMHLMLQQDSPADFLIATGQSQPLSELLRVAFATVGIDDPSPYVRQDPALKRPADVADLYGDPTKAREQLGWEASVTFHEMVEHMVRIDLQRLSSGGDDVAEFLLP
ncbi:GDP-mannose 4,6-dehydratase [Nocardioides sp.]|uniref:GDP-mannose 4,6-dehydratase n=1 Tax=Nocardioides sp. TaxID=35761 RepID=UPI00271C8F03|nr:GDP-mannose 4,6-dehydratase [Nocardioides sp.]MDO9454962.1 GDP-mannose 4,6-dehydratase [Nocardioides sp.]